MENGKWKIVLLAFFLGMSIVSFFWIIGCCMQNYIAEYFFFIHISICHHLCRLLHFLGNCEQKMKTEVQP